MRIKSRDMAIQAVICIIMGTLLIFMGGPRSYETLTPQAMDAWLMRFVGTQFWLLSAIFISISNGFENN